MPRETDTALEARIVREAGPFERPIALWDLDSTVCSTVKRRYMVDLIHEGKNTWDEYAMKCADDDPLTGSVALIRELAGLGWHNIAISGRSACAKDLTWNWFSQYEVPFWAAILRADGDHTPNGIYKVRAVKIMQKLGADIRLFFEDWDVVAKQVYEDTGVPVVGINPFDPEELGERQGAV